MLEKNRFLAIKNLAKDIRKENNKIFKAFAKETMEDAIREKEEFIESVIDSMEIAFSEGEQGKEEKQIFRANILIPDDADFFASYSKDKNIRNLMNKYAVSIEDVMSKITELNIYGKYIDALNKDVLDDDDDNDDDDFVNEMVNLSSKEAESLLDEIEDLSNVMEEYNIPEKEEEEEKPVKSESDVEDNTPSDDIIEPTDMALDDEFENISNAVSGFVEEYDRVSADLKNASSMNHDLKEQVASLKQENETLKKNNMESANALNEMRTKKNLVENENQTLKEQIKVMERKIRQSSELLKRIYNSIPKK